MRLVLTTCACSESNGCLYLGFATEGDADGQLAFHSAGEGARHGLAFAVQLQGLYHAIRFGAYQMRWVTFELAEKVQMLLHCQLVEENIVLGTQAQAPADTFSQSPLEYITNSWKMKRSKNDYSECLCECRNR